MQKVMIEPSFDEIQSNVNRKAFSSENLKSILKDVIGSLHLHWLLNTKHSKCDIHGNLCAYKLYLRGSEIAACINYWRTCWRVHVSSTLKTMAQQMLLKESFVMFVGRFFMNALVANVLCCMFYQ
ncbi:hypothetical protein EB796_008894 [Bugula neritina]|uniref:Uncharacterized protein n=1 Tax=Bugula neritina TaxID=10212 RepID=A0A7J7K5D3_BUGNE|nr:hypothetical protein EB796_008894 [Bugula neritina]